MLSIVSPIRPLLSWKKIARGMERVRKAANDRAPTLEEIQRVIEYLRAVDRFLTKNKLRVPLVSTVASKSCSKSAQGL